MIDIKILASGSSGNAYMVSGSRSTILLDAGISYKEIQRRSGFKKIDLALITHAHKDHSKCIRDLLRYGIETYAPSNCFTTAYDDDFFTTPYSSNAFIAIPGDGSVFESWKVMPFELVHDVECVGYFIQNRRTDEKLVYITDTLYCKYTFPGVTHFLIECNNSRDILDENVANGTLNVSLRNRVAQNHMDIETVKGILMANNLSKVEAIYLLHLSNDNSDAERFRREVAELTGKLVIVA